MIDLFGSRYDLNMAHLDDLALSELVVELDRDSGTGIFSVHTNSRGDRILTYSHLDIFRRVFRIGQMVFGNTSYHLEGVEQRDIRKLIVQANRNKRRHRWLLDVLEKNLLPQAQDTDRWSQPVAGYKGLYSLFLDIAESSSLQQDVIIAKEDDQGVRLLLLSRNEVTPAMLNESRQALSKLIKDIYGDILLWDRSDVGLGGWVTETFYGSTSELKGEGSLFNLRQCISKSLRLMIELTRTSTRLPSLNEMLGVKDMPSVDALLKDRGILTVLVNLSPNNEVNFVFPFILELLQFQERQILERIGFSENEMSRSELVARLKELDPADPEINSVVLRKLIAQASLFEAMEKMRKQEATLSKSSSGCLSMEKGRVRGITPSRMSPVISLPALML